ncbi:MAG: hypothetical protein RI947_65 [Candidatus Parcubacteria bacterium]|jgi:glycogen debranching enzyme
MYIDTHTFDIFLILMDSERLKNIAYNCLLDLSTEDGINASSKDEIYGCIFGRDSALTVLKIIHALSYGQPSLQSDQPLIDICRRSLLFLIKLQGTEVNIESGEEPGKFIHEYRREKFDHLLALSKPWYIYPDMTIRNYDSIDATPLILIAIFRYWQFTHDDTFLQQSLPAVKKGLEWLCSYADLDRDGLVEYTFAKGRKFGGLDVQSWTDSVESLMRFDGSLPAYPIAPVEVQGYVWLALRLWGDVDGGFGIDFLQHAAQIKTSFNNAFILQDNGYHFAAQALDGTKQQITTITANPLLLLWATYTTEKSHESILDDKYVDDFIKRGFLPDLFDPDAGIRTMSSKSATYNSGQDSYHNGSYWPILNGMIYEGLCTWGYTKEAKILKVATLKPLFFFNSPIELYIKNAQGTYLEYRNSYGQVSCRYQAWSAAAIFDILNP